MGQKSVTLSRVKTSQITKEAIKSENSTQRAWTALLEGAEELKSILTERQRNFHLQVLVENETRRACSSSTCKKVNTGLLFPLTPSIETKMMYHKAPLGPQCQHQPS